jgi:hypothetical protein
MHRAFAIFILLLLFLRNAGAVTIETSAGNRYDVATDGPLSPYLATMSDYASMHAGGPAQSYEFMELKYKSVIPFLQRKAVREEAIEIFEKYQKATGQDLFQKIRDGMENGKLITIFLWVGSGQPETKVRTKKGGVLLEKRVTPYYYVAVMNPASGTFEPFLQPIGEYWLRERTREVALPFLNDEPGPDIKPYLNEILGVIDSPLWVAFRIVEMRRDSVDLKIEIFDEQKIIQSQLIPGCIRTNLGDQETIASYSVRSSSDNAALCFATKTGTMYYDVKSLTITPASSLCQ